MGETSLDILLRDELKLSFGLLEVLNDKKAVSKENGLQSDVALTYIVSKCGIMRLEDLVPDKRQAVLNAFENALRHSSQNNWAKRELNKLWLTQKGQNLAQSVIPMLPPPSAAIIQISDIHFGQEMHVFGAKYYESIGKNLNQDAMKRNVPRLRTQIEDALKAHW